MMHEVHNLLKYSMVQAIGQTSCVRKFSMKYCTVELARNWAGDLISTAQVKIRRKDFCGFFERFFTYE